MVARPYDSREHERVCADSAVRDSYPVLRHVFIKPADSAAQALRADDLAVVERDIHKLFCKLISAPGELKKPADSQSVRKSL